MTIETNVADHYTSGTLLNRIKTGLTALGVDPASAGPEDLKPVDEFHIGGIEATRDLLAQLDLAPPMQILDIGSGLGGTPRFVAGETGCTVTGIDLTPEFVATATALSAMVGLSGQTRFHAASALQMPFEDASFDAALMLHVGMNIPDKPAIMAEAARVLRPGAHFAVYDIMQTNDEEIIFPVPWSEAPHTSFMATPETYRDAAEAAGFTVEATRERRQFALDFFAMMRARMADAEGPPALGLHLILGETANDKFRNMAENIAAGRFAPVEMILRMPG